MNDREYRAFPGALRIEKRADREVIEGHAAVFGQKAEIFGFTEEIAAGAFRDSIAQDDIRALINHDNNLVLGRNKAGTLRLKEDGVGLFIENDPPDTQAARDLLALLRRGDINQMSFGFRTLDDEWRTVDGVPHRTLKRVQLFDVSPVTFPAYEGTDVGIAMRSLGEHLKREAAVTAGQGQPEKAKAEAEAAARDRELELKAKP